jgi:transposase
MTTTRRTFTDEFKREAVSLLGGRGRRLTQVATELGIQPSMLRAWRGNGTTAAGLASLPARAGGAMPGPAPEQAEIRRLQKELDRARMERDILTKAIGIVLTKAIGIVSGPPR